MGRGYARWVVVRDDDGYRVRLIGGHGRTTFTSDVAYSERRGAVAAIKAAGIADDHTAPAFVDERTGKG